MPADEVGDRAKTKESLGREEENDLNTSVSTEKIKIITPKPSKKRRKFGRTNTGRNKKSTSVIVLNCKERVDNTAAETEQASAHGDQSLG